MTRMGLRCALYIDVSSKDAASQTDADGCLVSQTLSGVTSGLVLMQRELKWAEIRTFADILGPFMNTVLQTSTQEMTHVMFNTGWLVEARKWEM